jgi:predicted Zn-dependent protease
MAQSSKSQRLSHNVTEVSYASLVLKSLAGLGILAIIVFVLFEILFFCLIRFAPSSWEEFLGEQLVKSFKEEDAPPHKKEEQAQKVFEKIAAQYKGKFSKLKFFIISSPEENAVTLPGGVILVFTGLLDKVQSENELAMIIGHEIAHVQNKDVSKRLSLGIALTIISIIFSGDDFASGIVGLSSQMSSLSFSRTQESEADREALELLNSAYGNISGAIDFFERMAETENDLISAEYLRTHPYSETRIAELKRIISENGWKSGKKIKFN